MRCEPSRYVPLHKPSRLDLEAGAFRARLRPLLHSITVTGEVLDAGNSIAKNARSTADV